MGMTCDGATNLLEASIRHASKGYSIRIYIDVLDGCGEDVARDSVAYFQHLTSKLASTEATLNICFSCRYYPVVAPEHSLAICAEDESLGHGDLCTR
jgi:hypothetical protein